MDLRTTSHRLAMTLALAVLLPVGPSPAGAAADCDEKGPPVLVAEQLCANWKGRRPDVRSSTTCCLPIQKKAKRKQDQALAEDKKARDPKLSDEEKRKHRARSNELFAQRGELAEQFIHRCLNPIEHALNLEKQNGTSPRGAVTGACGGPVEFIENLGWRPCVDLDRSTLSVDRLMGLTQHDYNCHYYTKSFIQTANEDQWTPPGAGSFNDCVGRDDRPGYSLTRGPVHIGDLVLVKGPDALPCPYHHSGIVIAVNPDGTPKRIRQKDGPNTCVVDLDWDEFQQVWVNRNNIKPLFYTNPDHAGTLPRWE